MVVQIRELFPGSSRDGASFWLPGRLLCAAASLRPAGSRAQPPGKDGNRGVWCNLGKTRQRAEFCVLTLRV